MQRFNPYFLALACAAALASAPALSAGPLFDAHPSHQRGRGPGMDGMLHGLKLSEAQRQKAFAIRHAAAPLHFEQMGQVRKAHDTLRQLAEAPQFDEAKAGAAANELGSASAALALGRARVAAQMHALLTAEQRAELARRPHKPHRR